MLDEIHTVARRIMQSQNDASMISKINSPLLLFIMYATNQLSSMDKSPDSENYDQRGKKKNKRQKGEKGALSFNIYDVL